MIRPAVLPRVLRAAAVAGVLLSSSFALTSASSTAASSTSAVTKTATVKRTFIDNGKTKVIDKRKITLKVDQTTNLRSLQLIHVSWSGAHPTGGLVADTNSDLAQNEEYSFVLFECRGTDSTSRPLTPNTCWTQYADERFAYGYDSYPAWRSDSAATARQRAAFVGAPKNQPTECVNTLFQTANQRWVPFVGADRHVYEGGVFGCAGEAPEASPANYTSLSLPTNETFGVTGTDGRGAAAFDIFTNEDHQSLGCSANVPCSLVAVPIEGVSCDPEGSLLPEAQRPTGSDIDDARTNCESKGNFQPGQQLPAQGSGAAAVDGTLWWSPSNWKNRISVPLNFAPSDNVCALDTSAAPVDVYGSELLAQATTQWAPAFCLNPKLFDLTHVQTPEPQARNLLGTGNIEAAYTSEPPDVPYSNPTVNAPVAVTGFGIAFVADNTDQNPVVHLNLDGRLLAKLLTESYPAEPFVQSAYPALANNPLNITFDPEFQALNPGIPPKLQDAAATLLTLNTDSDLVYAMTSYINSDPEARAWLNGKADPWGMVVNPNYKKIALPVDNWPLLDSFEPLAEYQPGRNDCLYYDPLPYLPLVAAPTARLFSIGQDMQFALSQSQTTCALNPINPRSLEGAKLVANGRQATGSRFMLGTVSLGDAAREGLSLASLETTSSVSPQTAITSTAGRTFVAPTTSALKAAAQALKPDKKSGTWPIPYGAFRKNAAAYPGTMVVYAAVPTKGLPKGDALDYSKLLTFAAGPGQRPGTAQGDLAPGYLPITQANGLAGMAGYTARAASAVRAQAGDLPPLVSTGPPSHPSDSTSSSPRPSGSSTVPHPSHSPSTVPPGPGAGVGGNGAPSSTPTNRSSTSGSSSASPHPSTSTQPSSVSLSSASAVAARTPALQSNVSAIVLPGVLGVALVAGFLVAALRIRPRGKRAP